MRTKSAVKRAVWLLGMPLLFPLLFVAARAADPVGTLAIKSQGYFYVGGQYDNPANPTYMSGQMYVDNQIPDAPPKYPIILVHGGSHTGAGWQSTPDGRSGWADFFAQHGWPVYVVDQPGRGRSTYSAAAYGPLAAPTTPKSAEDRWAASEKGNRATQWPEAFLHTPWEGKAPISMGIRSSTSTTRTDAGHRQSGRAHPRRVDCPARKTRAVHPNRALAAGPRDLASGGRPPRSRQSHRRGGTDRPSLRPQRGRRSHDALRTLCGSAHLRPAGDRPFAD